MLDLGPLVGHWGYAAVFMVVVLGNVGLPVPEETVLVLAGYLGWRGDLRLPLVVAVGVVSAVAGDNLGYWLGRRYGRAAIARYGWAVLVTPARLQMVTAWVTRYGAWAVFGARFVAGLRFLAGPLAGATGLPPLRFLAANVLGAGLYVPSAVGLGYAMGYGLGDRIEWLRQGLGRVEHWGLLAVGLLTVGVLALRVLRARRADRGRHELGGP